MSGGTEEPERYRTDTYGRSFADVYDEWYPTDDATRAAARRISRLADGHRVLELGVGTGRLALELADLGVTVVGLDPSTDMLDALRAKDPGGRVEAGPGDAADPSSWPEGPFAVVVAADNLLCNLHDAADQERCVAAAAAHLRPGGHLVVQAFVAAPLLGRERNLEVRSVDAGGVRLIATDVDPTTGAVAGAHVELVDGRPPRVRPWRVVPVAVEDLDRWCVGSGLTLVERHADWDGGEFGPAAAGHVSTYRRS